MQIIMSKKTYQLYHIQQKLLELETQLMKNKMERTKIIRQLKHYRKIGKEIQSGIGLRPEVKHRDGLKGTQKL